MWSSRQLRWHLRSATNGPTTKPATWPLLNSWNLLSMGPLWCGCVPCILRWSCSDGSGLLSLAGHFASSLVSDIRLMTNVLTLQKVWCRLNSRPKGSSLGEVGLCPRTTFPLVNWKWSAKKVFCTKKRLVVPEESSCRLLGHRSYFFQTHDQSWVIVIWKLTCWLGILVRIKLLQFRFLQFW